MWTLTNANTMVEVCEERLNAVVDIRSWRAVELGLAFRLLMPLGRIGRGGCRRVGAWLDGGLPKTIQIIAQKSGATQRAAPTPYTKTASGFGIIHGKFRKVD